MVGGFLFRKYGSSGDNGASATSSESSKTASNALDPAFQKANVLRNLAESLHVLLTSGTGGRPDWNTIKSGEVGSCDEIRVHLEEVRRTIKLNHPAAKEATPQVIKLTQQGIGVSIPCYTCPRPRRSHPKAGVFGLLSGRVAHGERESTAPREGTATSLRTSGACAAGCYGS